jgi:hypothetical protein
MVGMPLVRDVMLLDGPTIRRRPLWDAADEASARSRPSDRNDRSATVESRNGTLAEAWISADG